MTAPAGEVLSLSAAVDYLTCRAIRPLRDGGGPCGALVPLPVDGSPPDRCPRCGQGMPWHTQTTRRTTPC